MSSGTVHATPSQSGGGRAFRPGPRWTFGVAALIALALATVLVLALKPSTATSGPSRPAGTARKITPGRVPAWIPKIPTTATPPMEVSSLAKPILDEEQGYTVHALLPGGSTDITIVGPKVPAYVTNLAVAGHWPASQDAPVTFMVTMTAVKGSVPLSALAFSTLTNTGVIGHPKVSVQGGGRLPSTLRMGQQINLDLNARVPATSGMGSVRWAPTGRRVLVGWIYQMELD